jgi:type IV pilus assembly protein PilN
VIKINLLAEGKRPAAVRRTKPASLLESENIAAWALFAGFVLVGLLPTGAWWWLKKAEIAGNQEEIATAQREVDELAAIIREVEEYKAKQVELQRKIDVINELRLNQSGPVQIMDAVSRALPELLWLDRLQMSANSIRVNGRAFNANAVASFIDNLDRVPEFREPILQDMREAGPVYNFSVAFNFSYAVVDDQAGDGAATTQAAGG